MPQVLDPVTQHHIDRAADALAEEFVGLLSRETIARYITESTELLGDARVEDFLPVLVHRYVP